MTARPDSVLSPLQSRVLHALFVAPDAPDGVRLAGGTALSAFYLHHRLSFDLDLFVSRKRWMRSGENWVDRTLDRLGLDRVVVQHTGDLVTWEGPVDEHLKQPLRIQLVHETGEQIAPPTMHGPVRVESMVDLGVEKLAALSDRHELKQYVDLYFLRSWPALRVSDLALLLPRKQLGLHLLMVALDLDGVDGALSTWASYRPLFLVEPPDPAEIRTYFHEQAERVRDLAEGGGLV